MKSGKTGTAWEILEEAVRNTGDNMIEDKINLTIYDGKYYEAFKIADELRPADYITPGTKFIFLADISTLLNKPEDAKNYYDSALIFINDDLKKYPSRVTLHALAGRAYAGLGQEIKAVREGELAIKLIEKNKAGESDMKLNLAAIYTSLGDYYYAASLLSYLINNPSMVSEKYLLLDPLWKPVTGNKEFRKMLKKE